MLTVFRYLQSISLLKKRGIQNNFTIIKHTLMAAGKKLPQFLNSSHQQHLICLLPFLCSALFYSFFPGLFFTLFRCQNLHRFEFQKCHNNCSSTSSTSTGFFELCFYSHSCPVPQISLTFIYTAVNTGLQMLQGTKCISYCLVKQQTNKKTMCNAMLGNR